MRTAKDIFNEVTEGKALVNSSLYLEKGDKLVRFSNHKCNWKNVEIYNENTNEVFLVFVNADVDELEIQDNVENLQNNLDIFVDYVIFNEEDENDIDYVKAMVEKFLK